MKLLIGLLLTSGLFAVAVQPPSYTTYKTTQSQPPNDTLPSLPPLPAEPAIKRGWVGTFKYTVRMKGSGNQPKPYYYFVNFNQIHTGYIEFTHQAKVPIRVNQPDQYNAQRWESWTPIGRKKSYNYVNDSLFEITVITSDPCCLTPHDHYRIARAGSHKEWKEGVSHGCDLQMDYTTGTYILSMPRIICEAQFTEIYKVNKDAKPKNNHLRNVNESGKVNYKTSSLFNAMDTLMGTIKRGQTEIVIHRTAPITYKSYLWHDAQKGELYITPFVKGTVVFEMRIRRVGD
jgi:hypothetical protein